MEEAEKILAAKRKVVWREIRKYLRDPAFPSVFTVPKKYKAAADLHWKVVREYPERKGKYIRPTLLILTAEAMGAKLEQALKTAAAMQVSEDWILGHDDFEDDSLYRRGKPTLHRLFGPELAVNAGDTLHGIMWKIVLDNEPILGTKKMLELADEFYRMLMRTALGQSVEIKWAKDNKSDLTDRDWFFIADGKTSYYTIAAPMRLGAIIAGATRGQLEILAKFGIYLGRCFQLVDDVLDLTSTFRGLKKQVGNDVYEGKRTVPLGHLLRTASTQDKRRIISILRKRRDEKTESEVKWVIERMDRYGSIGYTRGLAKKLGEEAENIFGKDLVFLSRKPARDQLVALMHFVLERDY